MITLPISDNDNKRSSLFNKKGCVDTHTPAFIVAVLFYPYSVSLGSIIFLNTT